MALRSSAVRTERSPITVAAGFIGAFVVASLAVQLVRSMQTAQAVAPAHPSAVQPVVAHQATLWQDLGSR